MRRVSRRALASVCAGLWSFGAAAQTPPHEEIAPAFPELFRQAEQAAPRLRALEADVDAARGRARQASAWPNPFLGVDIEDVSGSGAYRGSSRSQTTVSLSEPLEIAGQRGARKAAGAAGVRSAESQRLLARLDFAYDLAVAYAQAEAAQIRVTVLTEGLGRAQEDLRSARAMVNAGKEADLRAVQADAAAAAAQADLDGAHADSIGALARLSSLAGSDRTFTGVTESLLRGTTPPPGALAIGELQDTPAVRAAMAERDVAEKRLIVERKRAIPTPAISVGTRKYNAEDAHAWVFGISVPLPLLNLNRGEIAAASAELRAAEARESATRLEVQAEARGAVAQLQAADSRRLAADQAETAAREAYRLARIAYEAGRSPLMELLTSRRVLSESQSRALDARVARVAAQAALARLAGQTPFVE
jgi:cobalt-zinc-cadmium efflux system outer membrane protein